MSHADLKNRFSSHPANGSLAKDSAVVREAILTAAYHIEDTVPNGREKSLAFTKLEEAMFWANAGIFRPQSETSEQREELQRLKQQLSGNSSERV